MARPALLAILLGAYVFCLLINLNTVSGCCFFFFCWCDCFPSDGKVTISTAEGCEIKEMRNLSIGDLVLSYNVSSGTNEFSKVITFLEYRPNRLRNYPALHLENGKSLALTSDHLVFKVEKKEAGNSTDLELIARLARHVKKGHQLFYADELSQESEMVKVNDVQKTTKPGAYNPLTLSVNYFF